MKIFDPFYVNKNLIYIDNTLYIWFSVMVTRFYTSVAKYLLKFHNNYVKNV